MKRSTKIACVVLVAGLLIWYFFLGPGKNTMDASVVGINCNKEVPEVYLLFKNTGKEVEMRTIHLTVIDKTSKEKQEFTLSMNEPLEAGKFRQDTVFLPDLNLEDKDCQNFDVRIKLKKAPAQE